MYLPQKPANRIQALSSMVREASRHTINHSLLWHLFEFSNLARRKASNLSIKKITSNISNLVESLFRIKRKVR